MSATQAELASAVSVILHGEDHIKCILEASIEQDATTAQKPRRLLALISHRDELDGHEEGRQASLLRIEITRLTDRQG